MAVKITTEKSHTAGSILEDLLRLGKRGHFLNDFLSQKDLVPELKEQTEPVVDTLSEGLAKRLHNPKNYLMACVRFALYAGMGACYLLETDPEGTQGKNPMDVLLYKSDLLSLDAYVADLTGLYEDETYVGMFRDFQGLFETRSLMLCCGSDPEKLNPETCRIAAAAMYMLGVLLQAERMKESDGDRA
ncbi:MAG: hypothetical protein K6E16_03040 [Lachnospiraceae bacterium]|nr:hypothetical protein [Lachnospiraceae bacterium]